MHRLFLPLFLVAALVCAGGSAPAPAAARIVAIGDVHGGYEQFLAILTATKLIDSERRWSGGKTILVQTGDVTDRGPGVRQALDLLMSLEKQASSAGGKVHALLGNHEVMNVVGDTRDVSPETLSSFGGEAAYREAFGRDGRYGKWLRSKPLLITIDGTVFMHAGINPEFSTGSLDDISARVRREIEQWDDGRRWLADRKLIPASAGFLDVVEAARAEIARLNALVEAKKDIPPDAPKVAALLLPIANIGLSSLFSGDGPLWFRGFATWSDAEGAAQIKGLLERFRVKRFVAGHNVQKDGRITERFGGSLFLIDTGMLNGKYYPAGRPSALELSDASAVPVYAN